MTSAECISSFQRKGGWQGGGFEVETNKTREERRMSNGVKMIKYV